MSALAADIHHGFMAPDYHLDPYKTYAACRAHDRYGTVPNSGGALGIFGHQDAAALLAAATVQPARLRTFFPVPDPDLVEFTSLQRWISRSILHAQADEHLRLRRLLERPLSPIPVQRYETIIQDTVHQQLSRLPKRRPLDVVKDYAGVLPTQVIARLLGLTPDAWPSVHAAVSALAHWTDNTHRSRRDTCAARDAVDTLTTQLLAALERSDGPLLEGLVGRTTPGPRAVDEIIVQCILFLVAGRATLRNLIANAVHLTSTHRDVREALADGRLTANAIIDETLRVESPIQFLHRTVDEPFTGTLGEISADTAVLICIGSAQRDPTLLNHADRFDPWRTQPSTLAFGMAGRSCLGRALARLTAGTALQSLLQHRPALKTAAPARWGRTFYYRGIAELTLDP